MKIHNLVNYCDGIQIYDDKMTLIFAYILLKTEQYIIKYAQTARFLKWPLIHLPVVYE